MLIKEYGENAVFELSEIEKPTVKSGHILVKIAASSVNTVDTMIRKMGKDLPLSPDAPALLGMDFAGIVEAIGEGVEGYTIGDEVYGCAGGLADLPGTLAEYIVADSDLLAHKPKNLSMREAAALPLVGITAYEGLMRAGIKNLGATPINYKTESVQDYVDQYTGGAGFDLVYDSVGGANLTNSFQAAALNGHIATTVSLCELDLSPAHFKGLSIHVVFMLIPMLHNYKRKEHAQALKHIAQIVEAGALKPLLDEERFTLEEVGKAHARLESGQAIGKVVVEN